MKTWDTSPGVYCGAYHSAKGLEFDAVILPFCGIGHTPHPDVGAAFGAHDAMAREGKLLYVGATRAKSELLITYSGTILTPLLPDSPDLYAEVTP
jgi:superfamily I DNA/RNA helicase